MKLKKTVALVSALCSLALLAGCASEPTRLNERALVEAVGMDYDQGFYTVTLLVYKPSPEIGQTQNNTETVSAKGESVSAAMEVLAAKLGRSPFFDNNRILILGRGAAEQKLEHLMAFLASDHRIKPACFVMAAEEKASDILGGKKEQEPPDQGYLQQLLLAAVQQGNAFETTVLQLQKNAADECRDTVLSIIKQGEDDPEFDGALCLSGLSVQQQLNAEETRGLLLLLGQAKFPTVSVKQGQTVCSAIGYDCKSSITLTSLAQPHAQIRVSLNFQPAEHGSTDAAATKKLLEQEIRRLCNAALASLQGGNADPLALGAHYRQQYAAQIRQQDLSAVALARKTVCTVSVETTLKYDGF